MVRRPLFMAGFGTILLLLLAGTALLARPVYLAVAQGRPFCLPQLPRRGDDPPQARVRPPALSDIVIPRQEDWVDYGTVLETGAEGEWDFMWAGLTPASVVKRDATVYFYYVAADGYRSFDGDARHRAVGVATSEDGLRFTKYEGNPIMTHRPYDGEEEGAYSAGVTLDEDGRFVMVYGAAAGPHDSIIADARFAYSDDGLQFRDAGQALFHCDMSLYGAGDEIFPVAALRQPERWVVYYQPNGVGRISRTLGAAWGRELEGLTNSTMVLDGESGGWPVDTWGNVIALDEETLVLFSQRLWWPDTFVEARAASPATPYRLSEPLARYDIPNLKRGVVFLDRERRTWFLYYNDFSRFWYVKLAPFGASDTTPPSTPAVTGRATADGVHLHWRPANEPDTGVAEYRIYRDGRYQASTRELSWHDEQVRPGASYRYRVTAVNFHGTESPPGEVVVTTRADRTAPAVASVTATGDLTRVRVTFSEAVDRRTAVDLSHYAISGGITIHRASLAAGGRTVVLETAPHEPGAIYGLTVRAVADRARPANTMASATVRYTASAVPGLAGRWLAAGGPDVAEDLSGYGVSAAIHGALPATTADVGLQFDGAGDYVQIPGDGQLQRVTDGSFSLAGWVRPEGRPASPRGARIFGRVAEHPGWFAGLSLDLDGSIQAAVILQDESRITVRSAPVTLGKWHHVAMVVDVEDRMFTLFVDGVAGEGSSQAFERDVTQLWLDSPRDDRSGAYFIGSTMPDRGAGTFFAAHFQGAVRDVRLYDQALSAGDVQVIRQESAVK
jgi:hypothetical protein